MGAAGKDRGQKDAVPYSRGVIGKGRLQQRVYCSQHVARILSCDAHFPVPFRVRPLSTVAAAGTFILKGGPVDEAQMLLDDHIVKSQAMTASPFAKPFMERLAPWEKKLVRFQVRRGKQGMGEGTEGATGRGRCGWGNRQREAPSPEVFYTPHSHSYLCAPTSASLLPPTGHP